MGNKIAALKRLPSFLPVNISVFFLVLAAGCKPLEIERDYFFRSKKGKEQYLAAYDKTLQLWSVPFEETDIATDCGMAHIIIAGPENAQPLILFNGMNASSTMWYPNIKAFSSKYRTFAIDFPMEAGKSTPNIRRLTPAQIVLFYDQVMAHFKLKDVNLVAISGGGWTATLVAARSKMKLRKMALISPAQTFNSIDKKLKIFPAVMLKIFPSQKKLHKALAVFALHPEKIEKDYADQFYLSNKYWRDDLIALNMMVPFPEPELAKIKIPVLVLIGDQDVMNGKKTLEKAEKKLSHVETAVISDSGHFIINDQPEAVNQKVLEFLQKDN